jgi:hypothetical protein
MGETIPFNQNGNESAPQDDRIYTNEEVTEIIGAALRNAQTVDGDAISHTEMLGIAAEFGLNAADVQRAIDKIAEREDLKEDAERAQLAFKLHALTFGTVIAGLAGINVLTGLDTMWFLYPFFAWGAFVGLHGILAYYAPAISLEMFDEWLDRHRSRHGRGTHAVDGSAQATFYIDEVYGPLAQANGIAQIADGALILEFEVVDSIFGSIKSKVKEIVVPLDDLASAHLSRGMWHTKLTLIGRRLRTFEGVPMAKGGEITLQFKREHRPAAEHLTAQLAETAGIR